MSTAGSKIQDDNPQEYQYAVPYVTPSGHELTFYDSPDDQRMVMKHTSGSHIEFKADGSVFLKAVKDLHMHGSVHSDNSDQAKGSDSTTMRYDTDLRLEIGGTLSIKAARMEVEVSEYYNTIAGTDLKFSGNTVATKATEQISMEGTKSIYMDTKEMRERVVSRKSETGTMEGESGSEPMGGVNILNVHGNAVIQNNDPNGGITIASKGYLNLVSGAERVDVVGKFTDTPSQEAAGTYTTKVYASQGSMDVSQMPGDYVFESEAGASYKYATTSGGSSASQQDGYKEEVVMGNRTREVAAGKEDVKISGIQTVKAQMIFLN